MSFQFNKNHKAYGLLSALLISVIPMLPEPAQADQRVCIVSDAGKKVCGKIIEPNREDRPSGAVATLNYPGDFSLNVRLEKCSRNASVVNCKFTVITTEGQDDPDTFYATSNTNASQVTDERGENYIAKKITIGAAISNDSLYLPTIKNQPIKVTLFFKIPQDVSTLKTVAINIADRVAQFSNVRISR